MGWKKDLRKAAQDGLKKKEVRQIAKQYGGVSKSDVTKRAENKGYFNYFTPKDNPVPQWNPDPASNPFDFASIYQTVQTGQENLENIRGGYGVQQAQIGANAAVSSAGIRADADKEVAKAYADAQRYGSELGLQGTKYVADSESAWREAVSKIEVQGRLDLQGIINAGLQNVAGIEAQAQRDVAETTGKYGLASTKEKTAADKSIGKMQLAGSMYGLLGSMFG
jgi:hypothetical protein